ncbi:hypothetical protein AKO1_013229 [Acrasis kona]|uniref:Bestrophin n=1 Tax=Acrasis kona TaxID=1008807 RepID=A0AAW2YZQ3_9EUKA
MGLPNRRDWVSLFFNVQCTVIPNISGRVLMLMSLSLLLCSLKYLGVYPLPAWKLTMHTLVGAALGLLLVYRTNASYDRFWEGRKLWGAVAGSSKSIMRFLRTHERNVDCTELGKLISSYAFCLKNKLRGNNVTKELNALLKEDQLSFVNSTNNKPTAIVSLITDWIFENCKNCQAAAGKVGILESHINNLSDCQGALERIINTPHGSIPLAYVGHVNQVLLVYLVTLPFCLLDEFYWSSIFVVGFVSFALLGIESAGLEIEDPFGNDLNDIPVDRICNAIVETNNFLSQPRK